MFALSESGCCSLILLMLMQTPRPYSSHGSLAIGLHCAPNNSFGIIGRGSLHELVYSSSAIRCLVLKLSCTHSSCSAPHRGIISPAACGNACAGLGSRKHASLGCKGMAKSSKLTRAAYPSPSPPRSSYRYPCFLHLFCGL